MDSTTQDLNFHHDCFQVTEEAICKCICKALLDSVLAEEADFSFWKGFPYHSNHCSIDHK